MLKKMRSLCELFEASRNYLPTRARASPLLIGVRFLWRRKRKDVSLPPGIQVLCERRGSECRIALSGRITIDSSADLRALLLLRLETNGCQTITVDLFEVTYIDTSGLAILVEVLKAARVRGKTFQISRLGEKPRYLLEATRLLHIFQDVTPA